MKDNESHDYNYQEKYTINCLVSHYDTSITTLLSNSLKFLGVIVEED